MNAQNLELTSDADYLKLMLLPIEIGDLKLPEGWSNLVISKAAADGYTQTDSGIVIDTRYVSLVKRRQRVNRFIAKLINQIATEYTESLQINKQTA